jgi:alkylation response protein AidB-like acyl-CoA dehydrogenase
VTAVAERPPRAALDADAAALGRVVALAEERVAPLAAQIHQQQTTPDHLVAALGASGALGLNVSVRHGGAGAGPMTLGLAAEALGRACSSVRSLLTVHSMVCHVLERWGTPEQRERWLPRLADGSTIAALALSESQAGSDASAVATDVRFEGDQVVLTGTKRWTTYGERADLVLVVGRAVEGPVAVLVETDLPGVHRTPVRDLIGIRGSMTADVRLDGVRVPADHVVGRRGLGLLQVAATALDLGRFTVAWGCVGLLDAAVRCSADYALEREQFGTRIGDHQLVRRMLTDMAVDHRTARLLCVDATQRREAGHPSAADLTSMAKYVAARAATRVTADAVQLHGAHGCSSAYPLQRLHGDAAVMEVIEGSSQLHQTGLADLVFREYATSWRTA